MFLMVILLWWFRCGGSVVVGRYRATHVFSRPGGRKGATKELMAVLEDLEKTHLSSSGGNGGSGGVSSVPGVNPIQALRETAGEALLPFMMSYRASGVSDSFI